LGLLAWLARREGLRLADLLGPGRGPLARDLLVATGLIILLMGVGVIAGTVASRLLFGPGAVPPRIFGPLPLWAALYSVVVWPVIWAAAEQMAYNGYAAPRLQALTGNTWPALLITNLGYGLQHIALPSLPDVRFMLYRFLPAVVVGLTMTLVYLRLRRLRPLIFAHWFADVTSAVLFVLLPLQA
jgi:membrane protease YdiL (CAAX protease family)